jgi:hypothetical protein
MFTVRFDENGANVFYNDNGPSDTKFVSYADIDALRLAHQGQVDPETCVELHAVFTAQNDCETVLFDVVDERDWFLAIEAVAAAVYLPFFKDE